MPRLQLLLRRLCAYLCVAQRDLERTGAPLEGELPLFLLGNRREVDNDVRFGFRLELGAAALRVSGSLDFGRIASFMRSLKLAVDGLGVTNRRFSCLELPLQLSAFALGSIAVQERLFEPRLGVSGELMRGMRRQFLIVLRLRERQRPRIGVAPNGVKLAADIIEFGPNSFEFVLRGPTLAGCLFEPGFCRRRCSVCGLQRLFVPRLRFRVRPGTCVRVPANVVDLAPRGVELVPYALKVAACRVAVAFGGRQRRFYVSPVVRAT